MAHSSPLFQTPRRAGKFPLILSAFHLFRSASLGAFYGFGDRTCDAHPRAVQGNFIFSQLPGTARKGRQAGCPCRYILHIIHILLDNPDFA
jgi:hypothetical protein